jgi:hypothetical protein
VSAEVSPVAAPLVLVEGRSDALVVEHLLGRAGVEGVEVVDLAGITNVERVLTRVAAGASGDETTVAGLCDAGEVRFVEAALRRRGRLVHDRDDLAREGWFVCEGDLEDELIRALGPEAVVDVVTGLGELGRFRTFQRQPEWRERPVTDQLHRFAGSGSGRKARLAAALADRLTEDDTPPPLRALVEHVARQVSVD